MAQTAAEDQSELDEVDGEMEDEPGDLEAHLDYDDDSADEDTSNDV